MDDDRLRAHLQTGFHNAFTIYQLRQMIQESKEKLSKLAEVTQPTTSRDGEGEGQKAINSSMNVEPSDPVAVDGQSALQQQQAAEHTITVSTSGGAKARIETSYEADTRMIFFPGDMVDDIREGFEAVNLLFKLCRLYNTYPSHVTCSLSEKQIVQLSLTMRLCVTLPLKSTVYGCWLRQYAHALFPVYKHISERVSNHFYSLAAKGPTERNNIKEMMGRSNKYTHPVGGFDNIGLLAVLPLENDEFALHVAKCTVVDLDRLRVQLKLEGDSRLHKLAAHIMGISPMPQVLEEICARFVACEASDYGRINQQLYDYLDSPECATLTSQCVPLLTVGDMEQFLTREQ